MRGSLTLGLGLLASLTLVAACAKEAPKPLPPPPPPAAPVAAPSAVAADAGSADAGPKKSKLGPAPTDGLSLAERMERRKASDAKLAAQLANDERQRLLDYDKTKLKLHQDVFSFIKTTRKALDAAKDKAAVAKLQEKQAKAIVATGKKLQVIDPKGGNSNVVTDYDVMLNSLANDYPQGLIASFDGDKTGLDEQRAELDRRTKKVEEWLALLAPGKPGKPAKGSKGRGK